MGKRFNKLNKYSLEIIEARILQALAPIERELVIKLKFKGGKFQDKKANLKLEVVLRNEDGTAFNQEEEDFRNCCSRHGFDPEDLGRTFTSSGRQFKITGLKPRNPRYPIIAERSDGKQFKFPASIVRDRLGIIDCRKNIFDTTKNIQIVGPSQIGSSKDKGPIMRTDKQVLEVLSLKKKLLGQIKQGLLSQDEAEKIIENFVKKQNDC